MPTTDRDAQALAYVASRLREETRGARAWDQVGCYEVIKAELVGKNLALAVEAVLCHATDPEAKTPGAIRRGFLPAKPSAKEPERFRPPKADEACPTCGGWCNGPCQRDRGTAEGETATPPRRPGRLSPAPSGWADAAREAIREGSA